MKINRTYQVKYVKTILGLRLSKSRTGNGAWMDGDSALPRPVAESFDRTVKRKTDPELAAIYSQIFSGKETRISSTGDKAYSFTVTGKPDMTMTLRGTMEMAALPLDAVPVDIMAAAEAQSSGRWQWDKAHLTITGKDADLEPWGTQAAELVGVRGKTLHCIAHIGKTFAGTDVTLNLTKRQDKSEKQSEKARNLYLEMAQEVVCGCGVAGMWDGDSWYMSESVPFTVRIRSTPEATAEAVRRKIDPVLESLERELVVCDRIIEQLSGWKDEHGNHCPEGKPPKCSVPAMIQKGAK